MQTTQAVVDGVPGGEHHDSGVAVPAHQVEQRETVASGKHDVEHHEVGPEGLELLLQRAPIGAPARHEARFGEPGEHRGPDRLGVLHHEYARGHRPILR